MKRVILHNIFRAFSNVTKWFSTIDSVCTCDISSGVSSQNIQQCCLPTATFSHDCCQFTSTKLSTQISQDLSFVCERKLLSVFVIRDSIFILRVGKHSITNKKQKFMFLRLLFPLCQPPPTLKHKSSKRILKGVESILMQTLFNGLDRTRQTIQTLLIMTPKSHTYHKKQRVNW